MNLTQIRNVFPREHQLLDTLYELMDGPGREVSGMSSRTVPGFEEHAGQKGIQRFDDLGLLARRITYGGASNPGRIAHWTLVHPADEAHALLTKDHERREAEAVANFPEQQRRQIASRLAHETAKKAARASANVKDTTPTVTPEPPAIAPSPFEIQRVALARRDGEDTRAIAGPDAPPPLATLAPLRKLTDPEALVAAARNYAARAGKMEKAIEAFAAMSTELGIKLNQSQMRASLEMQTDERLETIGLVLPYVDRLEADVARISHDAAGLREKARAYDQLTIDARRMSDHNRRLVSENAGLRERLGAPIAARDGR